MFDLKYHKRFNFIFNCIIINGSHIKTEWLNHHQSIIENKYKSKKNNSSISIDYNKEGYGANVDYTSIEEIIYIANYALSLGYKINYSVFKNF